MLTEDELLTALRGEREVDDVCRASGATRADFVAARDAFLRRRLARDGELSASVGSAVEILRDPAGVPHIYAHSTTDLYFGLGFATARDRLWQMDRLRRRADGRQAEVLGPAYVASDRIHRLVDVGGIAAREQPRLDHPTRAIVEAYVRGINRQIESCAGLLPAEFAILGYEPEPFTVRDVIAILRGMWWSLNGRLETIVVAEAARFLPEDTLREAFLTPEAPEERIVPAADEAAASRTSGAAHSSRGSIAAGQGDATGSNNWAVAGTQTATGRAILASDPHQAFWLPTSWYEYALHGPDDHAAGAGHPGVPGLWWGSNGEIAWGVTNNAASTRDLYAEQVDPANPTRYRDGDTWKSFEERAETILVRGAAPVRLVVRSTVRGPIMNETLPSLTAQGEPPAPPLSLRWVGQEHLDDLRALVAIGRAHDWPTFRAALRDWSVPVFNFGYADRQGHVGYQCAGRIPIRGRVARGFRQANHPEDVWQGYVPFDALPRLEDPSRGYVASANNRVAPDDFPYPFYGAWAGGHRATRLRQRLESTHPHTRDASIALQNDVTSARATRLCPPLVTRLAASAGADVRQLRDALGAWDGRYTLASIAPVLFETFMRRWQQRVARGRFPAHVVPLVAGQGSVAARLIETDDLPWFAEGTSSALAATAREAMAEVRRRWGDDPAGWTWGTVHQAHWRHPLSGAATADAFDIGPAPVDGAADTVRNTGAGPSMGADGGAEYRLIVDFAEPTHFWAVQNTGNSGQPGSPHYADQFDPWRAGNYHVVHLDRAAVEREATGTTVLRPEPRP